MTLVRWRRARDMHTMQNEMARLVHEFGRGGRQMAKSGDKVSGNLQ
jgi:hypothetical protein